MPALWQADQAGTDKGANMKTFVCPECGQEDYDFNSDQLGDDLMGDTREFVLCEQCDRYNFTEEGMES